MQNEIWKPVVGYEGLYEISSRGRVRSLDRVVLCKDGKTTRTLRGRVRVPNLTTNGYRFVSLYRDGRGRNMPIHRLIATAFIPNPESKPCIDHINRNPLDNRIENLRWCTQKENMNNPNTRLYARTTIYIPETAEKANKTKKERHTKTCERPVYMYSLDGKFLREFKSAAEASRKTGADVGTIMSVCNHRGARGKQTAGGYVWSRVYAAQIEKATPYKANFKKVYQYTKDGDFVREWESVAKAQSYYNVKNISRSARGAKNCMCAGFWWKYYKVEKLSLAPPGQVVSEHDP